MGLPLPLHWPYPQARQALRLPQDAQPKTERERLPASESVAARAQINP